MDNEQVAAIAAKLTKSEQAVVIGGITWSGAQRNRLIAKGVAPETCRGAPPMPRQSSYHTCQYALPLTELGLAVRALLTAGTGDRA